MKSHAAVGSIVEGIDGIGPAGSAPVGVAAPGADATDRAIRRELAGGLALRVARYPLQALFVLAVPPVLGPEPYSVYATCIALWALVVEATNLGTVPLFGRVVPGLDPRGAALLVRQVLWARLALAAGPGVLLMGALWTPRAEDPLLFWLVALAVLACSVQQVLFAALYAKGAIRRFMAADPLRSALSLVLVIPAYSTLGVAGAVGAIVVAQALLAGLAAAWLRLPPRDLLPPHTLEGLFRAARFGVVAALPTTLMIAATKVGTPMLSRAGIPPPEISGFDLATHGFALVAALAAYPFVALLPALGQAVDARHDQRADYWLERVVLRAGLAAAAGTYLIAAFGEAAIRRVLGEGFAVAYPNVLLLVGLGVIPMLVVQAAIALSLLARRPGQMVTPAVLLLSVTGLGTLALASPMGAMGASTALLGGLYTQAGTALLVTPGLARLVLRPLGLAALAAIPALALTGLELAGSVSLALPARSATLVAGALLALGLLRRARAPRSGRAST